MYGLLLIPTLFKKKHFRVQLHSFTITNCPLLRDTKMTKHYVMVTQSIAID